MKLAITTQDLYQNKTPPFGDVKLANLALEIKLDPSDHLQR